MVRREFGDVNVEVFGEIKVLEDGEEEEEEVEVVPDIHTAPNKSGHSSNNIICVGQNRTLRLELLDSFNDSNVMNRTSGPASNLL
jgi:division protein CdvB (Snf7/Vps24/ESCRT-III family)